MTVRTGTSENIAFRHAQDIAAVSGGIGIQSINDAFNVVGTLTIDGRPTIMPTGGLGIGVLTDPGNGNLYLSGTVRYGTNTTGAGSAALGANSPATTNTAPYTWITSKSSDGSTVYIPCWK